MFYYTLFAVAGVDNTPPQILNCPDNIVVNPDPGQNSAVVTWGEITAIDDSGETPQLSNTHNPGQTFSVGFVYMVAYTFWDSNFNVNQCEFTITVTGK